MTIPSFGVGTFRLHGQVVMDSVRNALDIGYRAIDTAQIYDNEADIGHVLADCQIDRKTLFLTTKIWTENFTHDKVIASLKDSLQKLRTDYVDLTLIHWPSPKGAVPLKETLNALQEAQELGLTKYIGVSNFTIELMQQALDIVGPNVIATNQIELSPYLQNRKVAEFAQKKGISITSYMTLAYGKVLHDPVLQDIATKHHATTAQVALAWALQLGYNVIPSSTKRQNLQSNFTAQKITLTAEDMARIATLDKDDRIVNPEGLAPEWN